MIIVCAALANYVPKKYKGKIPSGTEKLRIECSPAPIVLQILRSKAPNATIIAFKAEEKKQDVRRKAVQLLQKYHLDGVIGNTLTVFGSDTAEILILKRKGQGVWMKGKKENLANSIFDKMK
jgi:phosphopantothenoylcysteine synthetase/decarboxylase